MDVELSFCVVCTDQRELLERGLNAIARERAALPFRCEVLVLDNASGDGSADAARLHPVTDTVVALAERRGKAENDSALLQRAAGRFCLLLNEDSELCPGAAAALHDALGARPRAGAAGAALLDLAGREQPSAWRFPGPGPALLAAVGLSRLVVRSGGTELREVDWAQSAALMVRAHAARIVGGLDPDFFVYSDEVDLCKRLRDAGWSTLHVPAARAVHHEQLAHGGSPRRRIVELHRNRDLYMRKHHGRGPARVVRWLTAWTYLARAGVAVLHPAHDARRFLWHAAAALSPGRGEGLREAAQQLNARRARGPRPAPRP